MEGFFMEEFLKRLIISPEGGSGFHEVNVG